MLLKISPNSHQNFLQIPPSPSQTSPNFPHIRPKHPPQFSPLPQITPTSPPKCPQVPSPPRFPPTFPPRSPQIPLPPQVSRISLVDLAGSERADASGAKGIRLKVSSAPPAPPEKRG